MPRFAANLSMMFTEVPFLDRFEAAAKAGFTAVEFLFPYDHPADAIGERLSASMLAWRHPPQISRWFWLDATEPITNLTSWPTVSQILVMARPCFCFAPPLRQRRDRKPILPRLLQWYLVPEFNLQPHVVAEILPSTRGQLVISTRSDRSPPGVRRRAKLT